MNKQIIQRMGLITLAIGLSSLNLSAEPGHKWKKHDRDESYRWMCHERDRHWDDDRGERWREDRRERGHGEYYRSYDLPHRAQMQIYFNADDRRYLNDYYCGHDWHYWANRYPANQPPGLYKPMVRNGHRPPGLERQRVPFPYEIERRLCPLPRNYVRFMLG